MIDLGWFVGRRVELIDGEIIEMPAQKNLHGIAVDRDGVWVAVARRAPDFPF